MRYRTLKDRTFSVVVDGGAGRCGLVPSQEVASDQSYCVSRGRSASRLIALFGRDAPLDCKTPRRLSLGLLVLQLRVVWAVPPPVHSLTVLSVFDCIFRLLNQPHHCRRTSTCPILLEFTSVSRLILVGRSSSHSLPLPRQRAQYLQLCQFTKPVS